MRKTIWINNERGMRFRLEGKDTEFAFIRKGYPFEMDDLEPQTHQFKGLRLSRHGIQTTWLELTNKIN